MFDVDEPTVTYSRDAALTDGSILDATETAMEAGIRHDVALTRDAWNTCVAWTDNDTEATGALQDESGRLWDVIWMARAAMHRLGTGRRHIPFTVHVTPRDPEVGTEPLPQPLVATVHPGDWGEPVITIANADEI